jgi:hypothetical protein
VNLSNEDMKDLILSLRNENQELIEELESSDKQILEFNNLVKENKKLTRLKRQKSNYLFQLFFQNVYRPFDLVVRRLRNCFLYPVCEEYYEYTRNRNLRLKGSTVYWRFGDYIYIIGQALLQLLGIFLVIGVVVLMFILFKNGYLVAFDELYQNYCVNGRHVSSNEILEFCARYEFLQ